MQEQKEAAKEQEAPKTEPAIQTVTCDECGFIFFPKRMRFRREEEIEITYFTCPQCQHEYEVCRTNPELRKMQQKIENLRTRIRKPGAHPRVQKARVGELQQLTAEFKRKMDEFNGKKVIH